MTLRARLFLSLGSVIAGLVLAQWWWVRSLTADLSEELGSVAFEVSTSVANVFFAGEPESPAATVKRKIIVGGHPDREADHEDEHEDEHGAEHEAEHSSGDANVVVMHMPQAIGKFIIETRGDDPRQAPKIEKIEIHSQGTANGDDAELHREIHHDIEVTELLEDTEAHAQRIWLHREMVADDHVIAMTGPDFERREIRVPKERFRGKLEEFSKRSLLGSLGFLSVGLVLAGFVSHRVTAPLRELADTAQRVGGGELGTEVEVVAGGEVGQAIGAFNAMSQRLAALDEANRSLAARQHLGEIGEIARGLAHTLRNPLNALGLSVDELAAQGDPGSPAAGLALSARRQIRRIDQAIRSFLVLASQSGGAVDEVAVEDLVQDVVLEALQDARGKARLDAQTEENLPRLEAVEPELRAVLQALVVNAVEASPDGATVEVRVSPAEDLDRVRITVADRGPGLPEQVREHLFTPHITTKATGSGMGLFLAHRIATTRYGGSLELTDRDGGGTLASLEIGHRGHSSEASA